MAYAHANHGEHCTKCNDLAARIVGTQPLCIDHFTNIVEQCRMAVARQILATPSNPADYPDWAKRLKQGIDDGHITAGDARNAWEHARTAA